MHEYLMQNTNIINVHSKCIVLLFTHNKNIQSILMYADKMHQNHLPNANPSLTVSCLHARAPKNKAGSTRQEYSGTLTSLAYCKKC